MPNNLRNPNDFSNYYYEKLKSELNVSNINLNRLGFVGFFIELMGNTQFDVKTYYDHLFNESFPITARENQNLLYHSNVFGYNPNLALPSELNGVLEYDFDKLLDNTAGVKLREIEISNLVFNFNNIEFRMESKYKLVCNYLKPNYFSITNEIYNNDNYNLYPLKYSNSKVPLIAVKQYSSETTNRYLPKYPYGSFHIIDINLTDHLFEIDVLVREKHTVEFIPYEPRISKFETLGNDKIVFYKILPGSILRLEFGSGIHGHYIPEAEIQLIIKTTKGEKGNIGSYKSVNKFNLTKFNIHRFDYNFDDNLIESVEIKHVNHVFKSLDIKQSDGGKDPELDKDLKSNLIKYIQTRENLVSQVDYNNILESFFPNSDILFKKSGISENIIYVYNYFLNEYNQPLYSLTKSLLRTTFEESLNHNKIVYPVFIIDNKEYISPFLYEWNDLLGFYDGHIFDDNINFFPSKSPSFVSASKELRNNLFDSSLTFLNLVYNIEDNITRIYIKNKYFNDSLLLNLSCITLGINENLTDRIKDTYYYDYPGVIKNNSTFVLKFFVSGYVFEYYFNNVKNVEISESFLKLKKYLNSGNEYIINVPLIDYDRFKENTDKENIQNLIRNTFTKINVDNNRMISDDVQLRFSNTSYIDENIVKKITKQQFDFDIQLPFKIFIQVTLDKNEILVNSISIPELIDDIKLEVSKFILANANGINVKYYNTQIVDICHNFNPVKSCKVETYDDNDTFIPNGIETLDKHDFIKLLSKEEFLNYSSVYWWFDINNIEVSTLLI